jgi:hypothetical protein
VFSERDAEKRRAIIASLWAADGVFIDPDGIHVGRAAIDQTAEQLGVALMLDKSSEI